MPIYEYRCDACGAITTVFTRSISQPVEDPTCSSCHSHAVRRTVSTFAHHLTSAGVHERSGPPPAYPSLDYYKDPRNIGRHVEESFRKFGMDVPESIREKVQAAREGELPQELHSELP